ncbi:MAG: long-chain-fatty-acid--CoA ligase [Verrucomicrobia bacterium]|nr:long-chain-fatty-acid--CoA ligase [Verrucomicrobiota bacterium]MDA1067075.1 long-chain-fatty-acid--CoA ligase [Verrucomicrobiota bacterium]
MEVPLTPLEFARRARRLYACREAVIDGQNRWTYEEFFDRCDRWSSALQKLGISKGDRVAYISPNTHAKLEAYYAVPQIGAVVVPINFRLTAEDFAYVINHSGARVVCAHADYLEMIDKIRGELNSVDCFVALSGVRDGWIDYESAVSGATTDFDSVAIEENDLISINYTSGTTARPKGVMITHRNAYLNIVGTLLHFPVSAADRYLWTLPMFHANGWTFVWIITARGAAHVCMEKVEPATAFKLMETEKISLFCAAPTVLISLANTPEELRRKAPRGIRLLTAGAPPAAATIERVESDLGWNLTHVYGLTETAPLISVCEALPEHAKFSSSERANIKARQGVELLTSGDLRVVDDSGGEVPHDGETTGEIVVRGNVVMEGYFNDPDATAAAIRDGWFHSGDIAVVHPDGYMDVRDRIKDVIISGGENISSVEVEGALLHHPSVQEVAVVGMPHEQWGESPHAFVVLMGGATAEEEELRQFVRGRLAHFKAPQWITFVDELPKTATGKVQKFVLRGNRSGISKQ